MDSNVTMEFEKKVLTSANCSSNWKTRFTSPKTINHLLRAIGLTSEKVVDLQSIPGSLEYRHTVLFKTQNIKTGSERKGIIDFTIKNPSWHQFVDITYDSGSGTDLKIIVYEGGEMYSRDGDEPPGNSMTVSNLVARNNRCGVTTFLVEAEGLSSPTTQKLAYSAEISEGDTWSQTKGGQYETLPTKRQVQEAEFWLEYYNPIELCDYFVEMEDDIIHDYAPSYVLHREGIRTEVRWTEEGLLMTLVDDNQSGFIDRIWDRAKPFLANEYPGCSINLRPDCKNGGVMIVVTVNRLPLGDILKLNPADKENYGQEVFDKERKFYEIVEELFDFIDNQGVKA